MPTSDELSQTSAEHHKINIIGKTAAIKIHSKKRS